MDFDSFYFDIDPDGYFHIKQATPMSGATL